MPLIRDCCNLLLFSQHRTDHLTVMAASEEVMVFSCFLAIMNNEVGLQTTIKEQTGILQLVRSSFVQRNPNYALQAQVADVLSALCLYSHDGFLLVLDALDGTLPVQSPHEEESVSRNPFRFFAQCLSMDIPVLTQAAVVALLNAVISGAEGLAERMFLRIQFLLACQAESYPQEEELACARLKKLRDLAIDACDLEYTAYSSQAESRLEQLDALLLQIDVRNNAPARRKLLPISSQYCAELGVRRATGS